MKYREERYEGVKGRKRWFNNHLPKIAERHPVAHLPYLIDAKEHIYLTPEAIQLYLCEKNERWDLLGRNFEEELAAATAQSVMKDFYPHFINLCYGDFN